MNGNRSLLYKVHSDRTTFTPRSPSICLEPLADMIRGAFE